MSKRPPRGLTAEERALWAQVASSVTPLHPASGAPPANQTATQSGALMTPTKAPVPKASKLPPGRQSSPMAGVSKPVSLFSSGLDSHWDRRLTKAVVAPDFTLDLHGHTLDRAYHRLNAGLAQAKAMRARLVLVVTGKPRPVDSADRASKRGAIRAKILDWLAAGAHHQDIAAIRNAHPRHGGRGALYIVLRRN